MEHSNFCTTCKQPIGQYFETYKDACERGIPEQTILDEFRLGDVCCRTLVLTSVSVSEDRIANWGRALPTKT